jgi:hypothetical protein
VGSSGVDEVVGRSCLAWGRYLCLPDAEGLLGSEELGKQGTSKLSEVQIVGDRKRASRDP